MFLFFVFLRLGKKLEVEHHYHLVALGENVNFSGPRPHINLYTGAKEQYWSFVIYFA